MAGVYDIETHYQYEYGRGVAELSTMKRAMGGRHKFPSQSPALILNAACGGKAKAKLPGLADESPVGSRYETNCFPCAFTACFSLECSCCQHVPVVCIWLCSCIWCAHTLCWAQTLSYIPESDQSE